MIIWELQFCRYLRVWTCPKLQAEDGVVFKEGMELGTKNGDRKGASGRAQ